MAVCPLLVIGALIQTGPGEAADTSCMEDDCGFFSQRCDRCSIGVLGDMADRLYNKY